MFAWERIPEQVQASGLARVLNTRMQFLAHVLVGLRRVGSRFVLDEPLETTGRRRVVTTQTSGYTATEKDEIVRVDASGGNRTVSLPSAATVRGMEVVVRKVDSSGNTVVVDPSGAETIDGEITLTLASQWESAWIVSNGTSWDRIL